MNFNQLNRNGLNNNGLYRSYSNVTKKQKNPTSTTLRTVGNVFLVIGIFVGFVSLMVSLEGEPSGYIGIGFSVVSILVKIILSAKAETIQLLDDIKNRK